ncbi:MAG TPA: hypothetical protein DIC46_14035 [Porphyromonadaceae bacterium]|nr:hypothetical protein [Porphyromonadaceae bacterium]
MVSLTFAYGDGVFRFSVEDNGKGFDPQASPGGIGLRTMRERVDNWSGELAIVSEKGKGTSVSVVFSPAFSSWRG